MVLWDIRFFAIVSLIAFHTYNCEGTDKLSPHNGDLRVDFTQDGRYIIKVNNKIWLQSAPTWFNINGARFSTQDGSLHLLSTERDSGTDNLGSWRRVTFTFQGEDKKFEAEIHQYKDIPVVVFCQTYLGDTYGTSSGSVHKTASGFPSFQLPNSSQPLGYYIAKGYMCGYYEPVFGKWNVGNMDFSNGEKAGPMALYDGQGNVIIMSAFNNFMAHSWWYDRSRSTVNVGSLGRAVMVPQDFTLQTILYYGSEGVNKAFEGWGAVMQQYYNARNKQYAETDLLLNYIGYWTDRGAFYYYHKEKNQTYEQTVLDVWADAKKNEIPYRYIQYDSWFYPKDKNNGAMEWLPIDDEFPNGELYILNKTGWPSATHLKWWSRNTPLAKQNGGKYNFVLEDTMALPTDANFFEEILRESKKWGNVLLNHDWVGQMFDGMDILQTNVTIGQQFMRFMGQGAAVNDLTIELCTTYPRHNLAALEMPTVSTTRVSEDYQPNNNNWKIGVTSLWIWSIGQTPLKDVFLSSSDEHLVSASQRIDSHTPADLSDEIELGDYASAKPEKFPVLEAVVATLSAGPVAAGDQIGKANKTLLMRSCNQDGLLLKPSKPAIAIDELFYQRSFKNYSNISGEVYTTYTKISGLFFGIVFAADMEGSYMIGPSQAGFDQHVQTMTYSYNSYHSPTTFSNMQPIQLHNCSKENFCLHYTTPLLKLGKTDIILLGELSKWVPLSPQRVQQISSISNDIIITLTGAPNEDVEFWTYEPAAQKLTVLHCDIGVRGIAQLSITAQTCKIL